MHNALTPPWLADDAQLELTIKKGKTPLSHRRWPGRCRWLKWNDFNGWRTILPPAVSPSPGKLNNVLLSGNRRLRRRCAAWARPARQCPPARWRC